MGFFKSLGQSAFNKAFSWKYRWGGKALGWGLKHLRPRNRKAYRVRVHKSFGSRRGGASISRDWRF